MILTVYNFCNAGPLMRRMYFLGGGIAFHLWASLVDQSVKNLLAMQQPVCNAGDLGSIPGLGRFPGEGKSHPLQCSGLENSTYYSMWSKGVGHD